MAFRHLNMVKPKILIQMKIHLNFPILTAIMMIIFHYNDVNNQQDATNFFVY